MKASWKLLRNLAVKIHILSLWLHSLPYVESCPSLFVCMFGIVYPYLFAIPYLGIMAQLVKDINILLQIEGRTADTIRG